MNILIQMKKEEEDLLNCVDIVIPGTNVNIQAVMSGGQLCICVHNDKEERIYKLVENEAGGFEIINQCT